MSRYARKIEQAIGKLGARQHGQVTRQQLLRLGLSKDAIHRRVRAGQLIRVYEGVYAVGYVREDAVARCMAAVLACGPGAVLSHHSAAALWGFRKWHSGPIHVTAPSYHRRRGIKVHRSTTLTRRQTTKDNGIPVTKPARTLLDIAPALPEKQLIRAINDALISKRLRARDLEGTRLHGFVGELSRSPLEDDWRPWRKRYNVPEPEYNAKLGPYEADIYYARERVIVELDGWDFHRTKAAFEHDRERDAYMLAREIVTVRITRDRLTKAPAKEAQRLIAILNSRRTLTDL
jgi:hypothetical protein